MTRIIFPETFRFVRLACLALAITACWSSAKKEDLDVTMVEVDKSDGKPDPTYQDYVKDKEPPPREYDPAAKDDWQKFFRPPPSVQDRNVLARQLKAWTDNHDPRKLLERGRKELALGQIIKAETSFRSALRLDGDDVEVQLALASLFLRQGRIHQCFEMLARVREGIVESDEVSTGFIVKYRYTLAVAYLKRGQRTKGHEILSDLVNRERGFAPAYAALASSQLKAGQIEIAEFVLRRGLDGNPRDSGLNNLMGSVLYSRRDYHRARQWFDKALATNPDFSAALVNRANVAMVSGEYEAAEKDLERAIASDPLSVSALVVMGILRKRQGRFLDAQASFQKAVDLAPEDAFARFNLGVIMLDELDRPNVALRLFHEVLQLPTRNREIKTLAQQYIRDIKTQASTY